MITKPKLPDFSWKLNEEWRNRVALERVSRAIVRIRAGNASNNLIDDKGESASSLIELERKKDELIEKVFKDESSAAAIIEKYAKNHRRFLRSYPSRASGYPVYQQAGVVPSSDQIDFLIELKLAGLQQECQIEQGSVRYEWFLPYKWKSLNLHHDSETSWVVDTSPFDWSGGYLFRGELNDKSSWWQYEEDSAWWGQEVGWIFPRAKCNATIVCKVQIRVHTEFSMGAEDGELRHLFSYGHTTPDGNLLQSDIAGGMSDMFVKVQTSEVVDEEASYTIAFDVNEGVQAALVIINATGLYATVGLVSALGSYTVSRHVDYMLIPR